MTLIQSRFVTARTCAVILCCALTAAPVQAQQGEVDKLVEEILHDVVDRTIDQARRDVMEYTGVDLYSRGYREEGHSRRGPTDRSREKRRELRQLGDEHDRELAKLKEELQRKLHRAQAEFEREAARENKPEKVREKRYKLEQKVDTAYAKFSEKIDELNRRSDEKRERILSRPRGHGRGDDRGGGEGRGRDKVNDYGGLTL